jgi:class 3 adenylate cyclase
MASFLDPADALRAALDMRGDIARFNTEAGADQLALKVGLHAGACLAVTLNDRLDYFGQTVNTAARVQALADAGEIVVSEDVLGDAGATALLVGLRTETSSVSLPGVAGEFRVVRILR